MRLVQVRLGFASNSSSCHSLIFTKEINEEKDIGIENKLGINDSNDIIVTSRKEKALYVLINLIKHEDNNISLEKIKEILEIKDSDLNKFETANDPPSSAHSSRDDACDEADKYRWYDCDLCLGEIDNEEDLKSFKKNYIDNPHVVIRILRRIYRYRKRL